VPFVAELLKRNNRAYKQALKATIWVILGAWVLGIIRGPAARYGPSWRKI